MQTQEVKPVCYDDLLQHVSARTIARCVTDGRIKRLTRGGNGRKALFLVDNMPEICFAINTTAEVAKPVHILEKFYELDGQALMYYRQFRFADGGGLDEGKQQLYASNASVLNGLIKLHEARYTTSQMQGGKLTNIYNTLASDLVLFKPVLWDKYRRTSDLPESAKRLKGAIEAYKINGYAYLISNKYGNINSRKVTDETLLLFDALFAGQTWKPSYTDVHDTYIQFLEGKIACVNQETGELYDRTQYKPVSPNTIRNYLAAWRSRIGTSTMRMGDRQALIAQYKPAHKMKRSEFAGSLVSVDDRQPPFEYEKGKRAWLYLGIDDASECYISWVYGKNKDRGMLEEFYRNMLRNCYEWGVGLPLELEAESNLNCMLKDGFLREGTAFKYVRIEANNARAKIIERYHQYMRYGKEKREAGWIARPFAQSEKNLAGTQDVPLVPFKEIVGKSISNIEEWNNSPHPKYEGMTRMQVFLQNQNKQVKPVDWVSVVRNIGYKTETSCRVGTIALQGQKFVIGDNGSIRFGKYLTDIMSIIEGENIDVYWLDDNNGNIIKAYAYVGDRYICELLKQPEYARARAEQTERDLQERELMSKYVATIEGFARRKKGTITPIALLDEVDEDTIDAEFELVPIYANGYEHELSGVSTPFKVTLRDRF